ncbi:MAG: hypothetical protein KJ939_04950 [Nanoarchaeota archaeon]|nr:hypothetical protein [Nanoarchaeota archaeon]
MDEVKRRILEYAGASNELLEDFEERDKRFKELGITDADGLLKKMNTKKLEELTLYSLLKTLVEVPKEFEEEVSRMIAKNKTSITRDCQVEDCPELSKLIFKRYSDFIEENYQRITKLYLEFQKRIDNS